MMITYLLMCGTYTLFILQIYLLQEKKNFQSTSENSNDNLSLQSFFERDRVQ